MFVSTDSDKYNKIARKYGAEVPYLRPKYLSGAKTPSCWVIVHFLKWFRATNGFSPKFITFCPPTNPMITEKTIQGMLTKLKKNISSNSIVTYAEPKMHPFLSITFDKNNKLKNDSVKINEKTINDFERSQDFIKVFQGSPACRITKSRFFLDLLDNNGKIQYITYNKTYDYNNCIGFNISQEEATDIDTVDDFNYINYLIKNKRR